MADRYASKNPRVMCVVPNVFPNGAVPDHCVHQMHTLTNPKPTTTFFDKMGAVGGLMYHMPAFFFRNSRSGTLVEAEKCITYLRTEKNVKKVATVGYCWGGTACISLGQKDDVVDAFCACHPSMPKMPDDLAKLKKPACFILPRKDFMIKDKEIAEITAYMKTTSLKHLVKPVSSVWRSR
jgi:dienelactone hydrolase